MTHIAELVNCYIHDIKSNSLLELHENPLSRRAVMPASLIYPYFIVLIIFTLES